MTIRKTSHTCWICGKKTREWIEKKGIYYCPECVDKKKCPVCGTAMRNTGQLEMTNPVTKHKRIVQVYICNRCNYRTLG